MLANSHKIKSDNFTKMEEVRTKNIEIEENQDKIDYINYAYSEG